MEEGVLNCSYAALGRGILTGVNGLVCRYAATGGDMVIGGGLTDRLDNVTRSSVVTRRAIIHRVTVTRGRAIITRRDAPFQNDTAVCNGGLTSDNVITRGRRQLLTVRVPVLQRNSGRHSERCVAVLTGTYALRGCHVTTSADANSSLCVFIGDGR